MRRLDPPSRLAVRRGLERSRRAARPRVDVLEGRQFLATAFVQTNLVSNIPGLARTTDPNLVNPWGVALGLGSGLWVTNNGTGTATVYDGNGKPIPTGTPLVVAIPAPGGTGTAAPTGQ